MNQEQINAQGIKIDVSTEISNFKKFAFKGQMMNMAIAFIMGASFQKAVEAISNYIIMPIIHFFISTAGDGWRTLSWTPLAGMTFEIGKFTGVFFDFFLTSVVLYLIYQKIISHFEASISLTKECSTCFAKIDKRAERCSSCTTWQLIKGKNE